MQKSVKLFLILFLISLLPLAAYSQIDREANELFGKEKEANVIVILKKGHSISEKEDILGNLKLKGKANALRINGIEDYDLDLKNSYASINGFSGKLSKSSYMKLRSNPNVERIIKDDVKSFALDSSVPLVNAPGAWRLIYNGTNVTGKGESICVIDSGIDYTHESLGACTTSQFLAGTCSKVIAGYDFKNNDNDPIDDQGHGTHVSGIISSINKTYRGVAPESTLIAMKVCDGSESGNCFDSDIIAAIDWCTYNSSRYNISGISMSLGSAQLFSSYCDGESSESGLKTAIDNAVAKNISVIVASGNDGSTSQISSPACLKKSTAVGSVTKQDEISGFSNRNSLLDLLAPGSSIKSTVPKSGCVLCDSSSYLTLSGTSMATPHVAGAFALLRQYKKLEQGSVLTPAEIQDSLNDTGRQIVDSSGLTFSRVNIYAALLSLDTTAPEITILPPTPANNSNISVSYFTINISSNEILSNAVLEFNSTNQSMSAASTLLNWMLNKSTGFGVFNYRVYANDSAGNMRTTETFRISINNTAPNITSFYPAELNVSINEPENITFNITVVDRDGDAFTIAWYFNGTMKLQNDSFELSGNYSAAGNYNITVEVSDGNLISSMAWNLTVNNTNIAPNVTSATLLNSDYLNRTNGTLQASWNSADFDNDNQILNEIFWYINNTLKEEYANSTFIHPDNTTRLANWTFSVRVFDGTNWSDFKNSSAIEIENSIPILLPAGPLISIQETQLANISLNSTDPDGDFIILNSNKTEFIVSGSNLLWYTNLTSSGVYTIDITANDSLSTSSATVIISISDARDFDNDGNPDFNESDDDNDGIDDENDFLNGNKSSINTTIQMSMTINGTSNLTGLFNGTFLVQMTNGTDLLIEFNFTFNSSSRLDLGNLTINSSANGSSAIAIKGDLNLYNSTKIFFLDKRNSTVKSVCIKDASAAIDSISSLCDSSNETLVVCNNSTNGQYSCFDTGTRYRINGLRHSAVKELCSDNDGDGYGAVSGCAVAGDDCNDNDASKTTDCSVPSGGSGGGSGGGGGGGGGGSGLFFVCNQDWQCGDWSACANGFQSRECNFVKVPQHTQSSACPVLESKPATSQSCEAVKALELAAESCSDGIKNRDEENIDCGGICLQCPQENLSISTLPANKTEEASSHTTGFTIRDIIGKGSQLPLAWMAAFFIVAFAVFIFYRRNKKA